MRIGLLNCDHLPSDFPLVDGVRGFDVLFQRLFEQIGVNVEIQSFDACHRQLPNAFDSCDGYMISGSRYSVFQEEPWIVELMAFVRRLSEIGLPTVGICFGHQVLAHALGGSVSRSRKGWGLGVHRIQVRSSQSWMQPPATSIHLHFAHQDQVDRLPKDAELLASNHHCQFSIFSIRDQFLGIQAHPEFTVDFAAAVLDSLENRVESQKLKEARSTLGARTSESVVANWIGTFLRQSIGRRQSPNGE